ncbi:ShlB/FhaC/HecB family hemolysin secretion/activation protein, partial [Escherichia coli]
MQHRQDNLLANRNLLPGMVSGQCAFKLRTFSPVARYFSLLPCLCILSFSSPAAMLSPGDRSAIQQQQQQLLDENQRQRDALERSAPLTITPSPETSAGTEGPCFTVSRIVVSGATRLTSAETDRLVAPWVNQCLNITGLTAVTDAVTDGYIRRGYITSRAFLTEQDLSGGVLHITVMEGRLQQIRAEGADLPARTLKMVFPGMEGKVLNLRDIEQGMEQINRLRTEPVQIEISPGDREGWSVVTLTASPEWPVTGSVGIDNSGQKNTGTGQLNGVLSFNNPLGLADNWFVSGGRSSDFSVSHDARNFAAGVSLPYGYTLVDYTYSWSDYLSTIDNRGWRWRSTGDLQTHRPGLSHVLFRKASLTVNTQRLDNQQNGTLYSAADLTLDIPDIRNSGLITGDNGLMLNAASLSNPGKIIADTLSVRATTLDGDGLLQGAGALALAGDTLSQGSNGRWLTAGDLTLRGKTLHTAGTTQGQNLTVQADNWANSGSVLATGNLTASATGQLTSTGDIMSQGDTTLNAATTDNRGSLLSAGTLSLDGNSLDNSGTVQGNHVTIRQNSVTNSGTLTGIAALTLAARMASPQPVLMNNGG